MLAKNFPNVYINMNEMYSFSPSMTKWNLEEWLDAVPNNKIIAFGGDDSSIEQIYAASVIARHIVAEVLAKKVVEGQFSEIEAIEIARRILRDNVLKMYKLKKVGKRFVRIK